MPNAVTRKREKVDKFLFDNTLTQTELMLQMICNFVALLSSTKITKEKLTVKYYKDEVSKFVKWLDTFELYDASKIKVTKFKKSDCIDDTDDSLINNSIKVQVYLKENKNDEEYQTVEFLIKNQSQDIDSTSLTDKFFEEEKSKK